jgi:hypothetical protein
VRASRALTPIATGRRDGQSGEPGLCGERADRYGGSGTGESIR